MAQERSKEMHVRKGEPIEYLQRKITLEQRIQGGRKCLGTEEANTGGRGIYLALTREEVYENV